jgi:ABC exporter DevB family membrane fusion protein
MNRGGVLIAVAIVLGGMAATALPVWRAVTSEETVEVRRRAITRLVVATGRVEPVTEVILANKIPGRVKTVLVREGDAVEPGQPLVLFDDDEHLARVRIAEAGLGAARAAAVRAARALDAARARWRDVQSGPRRQEVERAQAEVEQAEERWRNAERERRRQEELLGRDLIARSQHDAAVTEAEVARAKVAAARKSQELLEAGPKRETERAAWAEVEEARAELVRVRAEVSRVEAELAHARAALRTTVVEGTVSGKVTRRLVEPGEAVDIGIPLMVLADVSRSLVRAEVDETDVGKLAIGQSAEVTSEAFPGRIFPGQVRELGQAVGKRKVRPDDPTRIQDMKVLETKVEILDGGDDLRLGMTVDVKILVARKADVLVLPADLVPAGMHEASLDVVGVRGRETRTVRLGLRDEAYVEVLDGLGPGDRVIARTPGR